MFLLRGYRESQRERQGERERERQGERERERQTGRERERGRREREPPYTLNPETAHSRKVERRERHHL